MSLPDVSVDVSAQLAAAIGSMTASLGSERTWRQKVGHALRQVPLTAPQANSAGIIDYPDTLQAKTGYCWSVRRMALTGFTAGTATVYKNDSTGAGEPLVIYAAAGVQTFGRGEILLNPGDRLVVVATSITGSVTLHGAADCFESWYLPWYIG